MFFCVLLIGIGIQAGYVLSANKSSTFIYPVYIGINGAIVTTIFTTVQLMTHSMVLGVPALMFYVTISLYIVMAMCEHRQTLLPIHYLPIILLASILGLYGSAAILLGALLSGFCYLLCLLFFNLFSKNMFRTEELILVFSMGMLLAMQHFTSFFFLLFGFLSVIPYLLGTLKYEGIEERLNPVPYMVVVFLYLLLSL